MIEAWASAVRAQLSDSRSQRWLGEQVARVEGRPSAYSQGAVGRWLIEGPPNPQVVFAIEKVLDVRPGGLSRHLGYLPADAVPATSLAEVVAEDTDLTPDQREDLLAMWEAMRARTRARGLSRPA